MEDRTREHRRTLNEIVARDGKCFTHLLCRRCPLADSCITAPMRGLKMPSEHERVHMALDMITRSEIMGDE